MNIQNIQMAQSLLQAVDAKFNSGKGTVSAESSASRTEISLPYPQEQPTSEVSSFSKEQMKRMQTYDPPFFPLGKTQLMNLVEGVKLLPEEKGSSSTDSAEPRKEIGPQEHATTKQAVAVPPSAGGDKDVKNDRPAPKHEVNPGIVLSLKV